MRILASSLTYPLPNGVTVSLDFQAQIFKELGHEFLLVGPSYDLDCDKPYYHPVSSSSISKIFVGWFGRKERMFAIDAASEIKKIVEDFQPDIMWLQSVTWAPNAFERVMLESSAKKYLTYHTMVADYGKQYAGKLGVTTMEVRSVDLINRMDRVFTPSKPIADYLHKLGTKKEIEILPTMIAEPPANFKKTPHQGKNILYVGRVVREKNIEALFKIQKALESEGVTTTLVGPTEPSYVDQLKEKYQLKSVNITGALPHDDLEKHFQNADVFVFPSLTDTQGLVVGEAMIRKIPVVALESKISDYCYPESAAKLASNQNELNAAVKQVLFDNELAIDLAEKGHDFIQKSFSKVAVKKMIEGYLK